MLKTTLHTHEIPSIFNNFKNIIGEETWLKRAKLINQDIQGHRHLKDFLLRENSIVISLNKYSDLINKYGIIPSNEIENRDLYPAISFAAQSLSIIDHMQDQQKKEIIRRIHGAFKNPDDMRAIQLEMTAATHFTKKGYSVSWPEMDKTGRYDLFVDGLGDKGLEVECKSISGDKGKKIHKRETLDFFHQIRNRIEFITKNLHIGLSIVLTVPKRFPKKHNDKTELVSRICDQLLAAQSKSYQDGNDIRISEFDFKIINNNASKTKFTIDIDIINQITGTNNRGGLIMANGKGGGVILVIQSSQDDALLEYVFNTLSKSANNQLSKIRPAMFIVGFHDIENNELYEIAAQERDLKQQPTLLQRGASEFLASQNRDHIVGVSFIDNGSLIPKQNGDVASGGTSYTFMKKESSFWHESLSDLF